MEETSVPTENQIDPVTLDCVIKTRTFYQSAKIVLSAFLYIFLILFPWIIEIIVTSQISYEQSEIAIGICGILQIPIAIYGGYKLGIFIYELCNDASATGNHFWCGSFTDFGTFLSGGYILYFLSPWALTNTIILWVIAKKIILSLYVHMMVYMPLLGYITFIFVGYAVKKAISQTDYQPVSNV
jgi:hypothetical protein